MKKYGHMIGKHDDRQIMEPSPKRSCKKKCLCCTIIYDTRRAGRAGRCQCGRCSTGTARRAGRVGSLGADFGGQDTVTAEPPLTSESGAISSEGPKVCAGHEARPTAAAGPFCTEHTRYGTRRTQPQLGSWPEITANSTLLCSDRCWRSRPSFHRCNAA